MAVTTHAVMSPVGLRQLDILEEAGADPARVVIGHSDSYPVLAHWLAIVERGASIECDFLGMAFTPMERRGEPRVIELILELLARGHGDRILLPRTCATTASSCSTAATATHTSPSSSCRGWSSAASARRTSAG